MTTTATSAHTTESRRGLTAALLARRGAVYLPTAPGGGRAPAAPGVDAVAGVTLLEADLVERGFLLSDGLRRALVPLDAVALRTAGRALLADIDRALGADRDHTPLFRDFPDSTPADTLDFYVDGVLTVLLQSPDQPCVLCGSEGGIRPLSPCAHLVCHSCWSGSDICACPVCHRRLDAGEPFMDPAAAARERPAADRGRALPDRLRILAYGGDLAARAADAGRELTALLARADALSPQDSDDLLTFLDTRERTELSWLPAAVPGRETKARVLAWLLRERSAYPTTLPAVARLADTATDVLRLLVTLSGGDAGLTGVPRFTAVPRPLRRALLSVLDGLDPELAAEDMRRHSAAWKHAAERLHPFEHAARHPRAALAVAALRETRLGDDRLSDRLREAAKEVPAADVSGPRVRIRRWSSRVEAALAERDVAAALALLARRPGELLRRLDHLLRLADGPFAEEAAAGTGGADAVLAALERAAPRVAPAVLLSALGELRTRRRSGHDRVFFPRGGNARAHIVPDERAPLRAEVVERAVAVLTGEVLRRAGALSPVEAAVVDAALDGVIAPFAERTASRALVTLPRGSELTVPAGRTVRLFLHWMESERSGRTDLDLSAALFTADWRRVGKCDYTRLRFEGDAAVHSGDFTSAPAPLGSSEFIDLDLDALAGAGVRYAVTAVLAYNDVAFEDLAEAFAGVMVRDEPGGTGRVFDARQVEQRFDLTGPARAAVPMVIDVAGRTMRWLDVVQDVTGTHHSVERHSDALAVLGRGLTELYASGARVALGELAVWRAAARARTVAVRHFDGSLSRYRRRAEEGVAAFAARIGTPDTDEVPAPEPARTGLAYLLRGDLPAASGAEVFALHPAGLDAGEVRVLSAAELVSTLAAGRPGG
ncbi:MXAN_6230/SCO0854 family RING domain-containing protein [Streptomyces sp. NPDC014894]|uniref:MXAN_6230/SCO0854 family RING domain-containing protein n=1 Tax=Streptomyces sp. NPDC014894 TaxID=3364931 RepID=UPI0036FA071A